MPPLPPVSTLVGRTWKYFRLSCFNATNIAKATLDFHGKPKCIPRDAQFRLLQKERSNSAIGSQFRESERGHLRLLVGLWPHMLPPPPTDRSSSDTDRVFQPQNVWIKVPKFFFHNVVPNFSSQKSFSSELVGRRMALSPITSFIPFSSQQLRAFRVYVDRFQSHSQKFQNTYMKGKIVHWQ